MDTQLSAQSPRRLSTNLTAWNDFFNERVFSKDFFVSKWKREWVQLKLDTLNVIERSLRQADELNFIKTSLKRSDANAFQNHVYNIIQFHINDDIITDRHKSDFLSAEAISDDGKEIIYGVLDIFIQEDYSPKERSIDHCILHIRNQLIRIFTQWESSDYEIYNDNRCFVSNRNSDYKQHMKKIDEITGLIFDPNDLSPDRLNNYMRQLTSELLNKRNQVMITSLIQYIEKENLIKITFIGN